jgi:hypothetical protein
VLEKRQGNVMNIYPASAICIRFQAESDMMTFHKGKKRSAKKEKMFANFTTLIQLIAASAVAIFRSSYHLPANNYAMLSPEAHVAPAVRFPPERGINTGGN